MSIMGGTCKTDKQQSVGTGEGLWQAWERNIRTVPVFLIRGFDVWSCYLKNCAVVCNKLNIQ